MVERERELLRSAGHEVRAFEASNSPNTARAAAQLAGSLWNPGAARALEREIEDFAPDVLHLHNTWYALSPSVAVRAARLGVPVVVTLHNFRFVCINGILFRDGAFCEDCVGKGPWRGVAHRCYRDGAGVSAIAATQISVHRRARTWARAVDVFISLSEFASERHVLGSAPRERIVAKDNFLFDPGARSAPPSGSKEVLFVGRASPEKGLEDLLVRWRRRPPPGLRLTVIGPIDPALEIAGDGGVSFTGPLPPDQVLERMKAARALLIPSRCPEGQPLTLLEGLASGLPIVGTAIGGIDEVLAETGSSRRVGPEDERGWAQALAALADDEAVDAAGADSRRLYLSRFTPERAERALLGIYERARARRDGDPRRREAAGSREGQPG